ncbi:MAG: YbhB/YbcL family Raf kinase inhibitor-like protein [Anaerolineales bacterium]
MELQISSFANDSSIPGEFSFCIPAEEGHVQLGANRNPHLRWSGTPEGARSNAVICVDVDVPSSGEDVNQEGKTVPASLPRVDFYHWVLVDVPATVTEIPAGAVSDGVTARGKPLGPSDYGVNGKNDYTAWFAGDADMSGNYGGYDGPCPPWNDELLHHYHFRVYALDVASLGLSGEFGGADAVAAMEGHILDQAEWVGTYSLNPDVSG